MDKFYYKITEYHKCLDSCNHITDVKIGSYYCEKSCYLRDKAIIGEDEIGKYIICKNAYKK